MYIYEKVLADLGKMEICKKFVQSSTVAVRHIIHVLVQHLTFTVCFPVISNNWILCGTAKR